MSSSPSIYNAVYQNSTKKAIYKAVMSHIDNLINKRINRFIIEHQQRERQAELARIKATKIALEWERENTKRDIMKTLVSLKKKDDKLYTTRAYNNAIELAILHVKKQK